MSALHQELDEVAASTVRCACDHESILGSRLLRPRLQSKRGEQLSRRVDLDRELAGRLEEIVHRSDANQLAVIDDRHARADLLHLGQYVAGYEDRLPCPARSRKRSRISTMPAGSRPFAGSSRIRTSGLLSRARARPSRCFMPIEYVLTRSPSRPFSATISSTSSMRFSETPPSRLPTARRLSRPERYPYRAGDSTRAPTRGRTCERCERTSMPRISTVPPVGAIRPN